MNVWLVTIFSLVIVVGLLMAYLGWRKWRVVDPMNAAPRTPIILIIGLVLVAVGATGVGVIFLKQGVFIPGGGGPQAQVPKPFSVVLMSPADAATVPRNAIVQIFFNRPVKPTDAFIKVNAKGEQNELLPVPGSVVIINPPDGGGEVKSIMVFRTLLPCGELSKKENCFEAAKQYVVELDGQKIHTLKGDETLNCADKGCAFSFTTGKDIDKSAPKVKFADNLSLPASADSNVYLNAEDESGVAYTRFTLDHAQGQEKYLGIALGPLDQNKPVVVDVSNVTMPSHHFITAETFDIAGHRAEAVTVAGFYANHCFNKKLDEKETGEDCGGPDCGACPVRKPS